MNRIELSDVVAVKLGGKTRKEGEAAVNAVIAAIKEALAAGEKIQLIGFGTFDVKDRPARQGRNPMTNESIEIAASKAVTFKAGSALKTKVNG